MTLNDQVLELSSSNQLPELNGQKISAEPVSLPPTSCAFIIF